MLGSNDELFLAYANNIIVSISYSYSIQLIHYTQIYHKNYNVHDRCFFLAFSNLKTKEKTTTTSIHKITILISNFNLNAPLQHWNVKISIMKINAFEEKKSFVRLLHPSWLYLQITIRKIPSIETNLFSTNDKHFVLKAIFVTLNAH